MARRNTGGAHGGRRTGAGRKPLADGIVRRLFALTPRHLDALEQYRIRNSLASGSAAIRHLLDAAADGCDVCGLLPDEHDCLNIRQAAEDDIAMEHSGSEALGEPKDG